MTTAPVTQYKGHPVHVVHVTDIHQTIDGHDEVSTMAKIYFTDESQDDAYYVPATEVTGLDITQRSTDHLNIIVFGTDDPAVKAAALDELHTRALREKARHGRALAEHD